MKKSVKILSVCIVSIILVANGLKSATISTVPNNRGCIELSTAELNKRFKRFVDVSVKEEKFDFGQKVVADTETDLMLSYKNFAEALQIDATLRKMLMDIKDMWKMLDHAKLTTV